MIYGISLPNFYNFRALPGILRYLTQEFTFYKYPAAVLDCGL